MLYLDRPLGTVQGLLVWRDHADPHLFYYMSERPRLARSGGVPEFSFTKYKRDLTDNPAFDPQGNAQLGGGLVTFTVELGADPGTVRAAEQELARTAGKATLTPIQFRGGTVRLSTVKTGGDAEQPSALAEFFEETLGATSPSLLGSNRATFSLVLSQEGSTLVQRALEGGMSPMGVIYELTALALRPAFRVHIVAEYKRAYDYFETQFASRTRVGRVSTATEIGRAFQRLREDGVLKVEVLTFTDDEDLKAKADEAFDWFKQEVLADFFQTSLTPPAFLATAAGQGLLAQLTTLLGPLSSGEVVRAPAQPQMGAPAGTGQAAQAPAGPRDGVQTTAQINQSASASAGPAEVESQSVFALKELHQDELKRREFDYSMSQAVEWTFGAQGQFATITKGLDVRRVIREVDLDDEFFKRILVDVSVAGELEPLGVAAITVFVEYPVGARDPQTALVNGAYLFRPGAMDPQRFTCGLAPNRDLNWRWRTEVTFAADSPWIGTTSSSHSEWRVSNAARLVVDPLDGIALLDIRVGPGNLRAELVEQVRVDLRYEDPANQVALGQSLVVKPGEAAQSWKIRLADPKRRSFTRTVTWSLVGGGTVTAGPVEGDEPNVLVDDPFHGRHRVRLVPQLDPATLVEAVVVISYAEPDGSYQRRVETVLTPTALASSWVEIPTISAAPGPYSWETTVVKTTGDAVTNSGTGSATALLVGEGAGTTRTVEIRLASTDIEGAGLVAVRVRLTGPGTAPDREDALFTPSQTAPRRLFLVIPPGTPFGYDFEVVGWDRDGAEVGATRGHGDSDVLLVPLPHL